MSRRRSLPALSMVICASVALATTPPKGEFHVSPRGNDTHPGSLSQPFRTLERARMAIRAVRLSRMLLDDTLRVYLHGGTYRLSSTLVLGPDIGGTPLSPTLIAAEGTARPVVSGGVPLRGWKESTIRGRRLWSVPIPHTAEGKAIEVHQMWVDGVRRTPARIPNRGYLAVCATPGVTDTSAWNVGTKGFVIDPADLGPAFDPRGAEVVVMTRWVESRLPIASYDPASGFTAFSRRSVLRVDPGDTMYIANARTGLDEPGEFYVDQKGGMISYLPFPEERIGKTEAVVPLPVRLLKIAGEPGRPVRELIVRGLTFRHTESYFGDSCQTDLPVPDAGGFGQAATNVPAAVELEGARNCALEWVTVENAGTYGIALGRGCRENRIAHALLHDLGGGGVKIGMKTIASDAAEATSGNTISDSHICNGGKIYHSAIGIWIGQSPQNRLIGNEIHDLYYSGISIGWTWGYGPSDAAGNVVEGNHVHHIGRLSNGDGPILGDMGGIYTLGTHAGSVIHRNVFHDISGRTFGWGIYLDEGTSGILAEENLVYRTTHGGFHQHYGRENVVRNNVFAFGRDQQIQRSRTEGHLSFTFERNVVLWRGGRFYLGTAGDPGMVLDNNCYWPQDGLFSSDSLSFREWQGKGYDLHSVIEDPRFVDPETDDYRLREDSPLPGKGFRVPDLHSIVARSRCPVAPRSR